MKWTRIDRRRALAWSLVAAGLMLSLRDEPPVPVNRQSDPAWSKRPRAERAGDIRMAFSQIADETDAAGRDARLLALADRWIDANPGDALSFALSLPLGEVRDVFLRQLCVAWARKDPGEALAWADRLDDPPSLRQMRGTICIAVAESAPRLALELALAHGSGRNDSEGLLENLTMQWADREPTATLDWVNAQPDGEWHDRLLARVAFVLAKSDPYAAACRVAENMEPGPVQTEAILSVLYQWKSIDAAAAAAWVRGFPSGQLRERALDELADNFPSAEPAMSRD